MGRELGHQCRIERTNFEVRALLLSNERLDEMVAKAGVIMDRQQRMNYASEIQKIVHEEAPYVFLYNEMAIYGISKRVQGFQAPSG